jgi:hypothetical protein
MIDDDVAYCFVGPFILRFFHFRLFSGSGPPGTASRYSRLEQRDTESSLLVMISRKGHLVNLHSTNYCAIVNNYCISFLVANLNFIAAHMAPSSPEAASVYDKRPQYLSKGVLLEVCKFLSGRPIPC